jgi:hypothetical protein
LISFHLCLFQAAFCYFKLLGSQIASAAYTMHVQPECTLEKATGRRLFTSLTLRPDDSIFDLWGRKKFTGLLARSLVIGYARGRHLLDVCNRGAPDHLMSGHGDNRRFYFRL